MQQLNDFKTLGCLICRVSNVLWIEALIVNQRQGVLCAWGRSRKPQP